MIRETASERNTTIPWSVRRATAADLEAILSIQKECPEAPDWSSSIWRRTLSGDQTGHPLRVCFVAVEGRLANRGGSLLGFSAGCCAGELSELESVATSVSARGLGIGRALCSRVMEWCREQGAQATELEVRASNEVALGLYRSLGFVEQGVRRRYYRDPIEDAVLMSADMRMTADATEFREK